MSQPGVTQSKAFSTLLENHRLFLVFLERRVGTKADAEDILQTAS
jgi:DNA-directed RNA polymerase specialized sigma24 family protein